MSKNILCFCVSSMVQDENKAQTCCRVCERPTGSEYCSLKCAAVADFESLLRANSFCSCKFPQLPETSSEKLSIQFCSHLIYWLLCSIQVPGRYIQAAQMQQDIQENSALEIVHLADLVGDKGQQFHNTMIKWISDVCYGIVSQKKEVIEKPFCLATYDNSNVSHLCQENLQDPLELCFCCLQAASSRKPNYLENNVMNCDRCTDTFQFNVQANLGIAVFSGSPLFEPDYPEWLRLVMEELKCGECTVSWGCLQFVVSAILLKRMAEGLVQHILTTYLVDNTSRLLIENKSLSVKKDSLVVRMHFNSTWHAVYCRLPDPVDEASVALGNLGRRKRRVCNNNERHKLLSQHEMYNSDLKLFFEMRRILVLQLRVLESLPGSLLRLLELLDRNTALNQCRSNFWKWCYSLERLILAPWSLTLQNPMLEQNVKYRIPVHEINHLYLKASAISCPLLYSNSVSIGYSSLDTL